MDLARLDGQIYGEPLVYVGRVYVATENDTVYALSAATGTVAWSAHLGQPVPAGSLPCGNITPTVGITGTPVIDQSRGEIFVVADELANGSPAHRLVGFGTASGHIELSQDVDPPRADTTALLQRTGLTLDAGQVVFGFGGNYGDCSSYRGRVVAVPEKSGAPKYFTLDAAPDESQGAVWMGGTAPVVDGSGHIWVSTGAGSVYSDQHAYDDSDSILELSPSLQLVQFFAPGRPKRVDQMRPVGGFAQRSVADAELQALEVIPRLGQPVVGHDRQAEPLRHRTRRFLGSLERGTEQGHRPFADRW